MIMKKLLISLGVVAGLTVSAQTGIINYKESSLLSGWNVYLTNSMTTGPGATNLYTTQNGQILFANTNNTINGALNTNILAPDAFNLAGVKLSYDANGNFNANSAIHVLLNQTNLIPIAVTNSQGQWFVGTQATTNNYPYQNLPGNWVGWPLAASTYPAWMYPATTNTYLGLPSTTSTNNLTFYFQRGWSYPLGDNASYTVWDTGTNIFQFTYSGALVAGGAVWAVAGTPQTIITNLPTAFTQGADRVRCAGIVEATGTGNVPSVYILNALSIGQPQ